MRRVFSGRPFELHVLGAGKLNPRLVPLLAEDEIVMRGFVDDIDQEIVNADAFLCVNNATDYKVGHTRYLHAYSLGACVVAHRDASLSMPEIIDGDNALLGGDAREIAEHLLSTVLDAALRDRIGAAGRDTFVNDFTAERVVPQLLDRIREGMRV
jgi:glycosyltransferase involved in cell wall biosynthesis